MRRPWRVAPIAILFLITGCQSSRVDVSRETENLLATDRAWAKLASAGQNADSVLSFWTDDARVVAPGEPTYDGKGAIRQMVMRSFATPGFHVTWTTDKAVVSRSGDLGYTYGTNEFSMADSTGKVTTMKARGITVWRKEPDGRWRCVADYSTP